MYCSECGNETKDTKNFCNNCGAKLNEESKKDDLIENSDKKTNFINKYLQNGDFKFNSGLTKFIPVFCLVLVLLIGGLTFFYTTTPEYAFYKAIVSMKDNDYQKTTEVINVDKIVNNRIEAITSEMMNDENLVGNPFAGLAYVLIESLKPKIATTIKDSFKYIVESPDNVFQEVSKPQLFFFTVIKSSKNLSFKKIGNTPKKVVFEFNNGNDIKNLQVVFNKTSKNKWEIVDILDYDFWSETGVKKLTTRTK